MGSEAVRVRTMQWAVEAGYVTLSYPDVLSAVEIEEVRQLFELTVRMMLRRAGESPQRLMVPGDIGLGVAAPHPCPDKTCPAPEEGCRDCRPAEFATHPSTKGAESHE